MSNILIVTASFYPNIGGLEKYVYDLSMELNNKGHQVTILTNNFTNIINEEYINEIKVYRLPCIIINFGNSGKFPIPTLDKKTYNIIQDLKIKDFNLIITNTRFFLINHLVLYISNYPKFKVIHIEHGSDNIKFHNVILNALSRFYDWFLIWLLKFKVSKFYGVSERCNLFLERYNIKADKITNYGYRVNPNELIVKNRENFEISFVGRMIYEKGITFLLEAFSRINDRNLTLNIVGDGPLLKELKVKYNSHENIKFYGAIDSANIKLILMRTNIFINPSFAKEGAQLSVLEAGINKCALITTNVGNISEIIIDNFNGLIIKEKSIEEIKSKIEILINNTNKSLQFGENLYKTIYEKYTWDNTINVINSTIRKNE